MLVTFSLVFKSCIRSGGGWIRAASFKFGIGIQSRKVLEWDPKADKLNKNVPMDFKMQAYNRKCKHAASTNLSSEAGYGVPDEVLVEKMTVTDEGGLSSFVNGLTSNMDVTFSEVSANDRLPSSNLVIPTLTKDCPVSAPHCECSQDELMTSGPSLVSGSGLMGVCMDHFPGNTDLVLDNMDFGLHSDLLFTGLSEDLDPLISSKMDPLVNGPSEDV